jgi:hypothetical protein
MIGVCSADASPPIRLGALLPMVDGLLALGVMERPSEPHRPRTRVALTRASSRACHWIEQQPALEEGDAAPVFHRPTEAAGNRNQIELGQRIGEAEIVVVIGEQRYRGVEA